jgi:hypothetical protein
MIKYFLLLLLVMSCGKRMTEGARQRSYKNALLSGVSEEILLDTNMSLNFDLLPLKGEVKRENKLWSGDSWKLKNGAINYRWNSKRPEGFTYLSPGPREILTYPKEMMKALSPAEKFDLYMGRYEYPLRWEVDTLARSGTQGWEGLCHGWAGASLNHPEPGPVTAFNPDGVEIYFGSADLKALLTYAYSKVLIGDHDSLGRRCDDFSGENCDDDLTALTFHAVIANILGLRGRSLIVDVDRFQEVWNHPIISYESTLLSMKSTSHGRTAIISTKIKYVDVVEKNTWDKGNSDMMSYMTVKYKIEMDEFSNMVSSEWLSHDRPDFLWTVKK